MFDYLLSKEQLKIRDEVREFVKWVPRQMILDMDQDHDQVPQGISQGGGPAKPPRLPVSQTMGRPGNGLGHDGRGHGGDRHPRL